MSNSPGLVDFATALVNSVLNLSDRQVMFFRNSNNTRPVKSILLVKKFLGLVEMTSGLVNAGFSLPKWQALEMIFFAPCRVNFQSHSSSQELRFTDVSLKPATQTDHAKK